MGLGALFANSTGDSNTAVGVSALRNNTNAVANTAVGHQALNGNTTGSFNTALGYCRRKRRYHGQCGHLYRHASRRSKREQHHLDC